MVSQAATWAVSVAVLLVVPRHVGDEAFGQLAFAIVYISFFDLLATMGTNTFLVKTISRDTSSVGRYVANAIALKLSMTAVLIVAAIGLGLALGFPSITMTLVAAYCIGLVFTGVNGTIAGALGGLQLMSGPAKWNVVQAYIGGVLSLFILLHTDSLVAYAVIFNLALFIPILPNLARLWPHMRGDRRVDISLWPQILRGGFPFFILAALLVVYGSIDIPLLNAMTSSQEVGWYALAYRWVGVPAFFAATVAIAIFPQLSAEGIEMTPSFVSLANRAINFTLFVATPAAIGTALIAQPFLSLLYKGQFQEAVPLLRILALHIPIVGLDIILGSVVVAVDRQRQWVIISVAACFLNPLLNLIAIPQSQRIFGNGAVGAAAITVLTEVLLMFGAIMLRPEGVLDWPVVSNLLRIVLASLTMVPVVLALGTAPLAVQVAAGIITYGVASLVLRTTSFDEIRRLTTGIASRQKRPAITSSLPAEDIGVL
jgi:O-antigen/teichoic acid export membrane protein